MANHCLLMSVHPSVMSSVVRGRLLFAVNQKPCNVPIDLKSGLNIGCEVVMSERCEFSNINGKLQIYATHDFFGIINIIITNVITIIIIIT